MKNIGKRFESVLGKMLKIASLAVAAEPFSYKSMSVIGSTTLHERLCFALIVMGLGGLYGNLLTRRKMKIDKWGWLVHINSYPCSRRLRFKFGFSISRMTIGTHKGKVEIDLGSRTYYVSAWKPKKGGWNVREDG